jgi:Domain of unknown function (DUF4265)
MTNPSLVKVIFDLEPSPLHGHSTESVWASLAGTDLFCVENIPFYIYGIGFKDIVSAEPLNADMYKFTSVSSRSGHSTYRVFLLEDTARDEYESLQKRITEMGCHIEKGTPYISAIDIPVEVDASLVYDFLEKIVTANNDIEFEEAHCGYALSE